MAKNRLHGLDYLRGLASLGIMLYHYLDWTIGGFESETIFGRFGIYGVSIFYILSGLTLYFVYYNKMVPSKLNVLNFYRKRLFRILPLFWLITIISIIAFGPFPNINKLILNLTGLFGFLQWDNYILTGAWSIGNELVFYTLFPVFVFITKKSKMAILILSIFIFLIYIYFAFYIVNETTSLSLQWRNYINPLNQIFLFLAGYLIGLIFRSKKISNYVSTTILVLGIILFIFYPIKGDIIMLIYGNNRLLLTLSCLLICLGFFKLNYKFPSYIHKIMVKLGETSYSIYLIHPLVYKIIDLWGNEYTKYYYGYNKILLSVIISIIISFIVYEYFEKHFIKLGRQLYN